MPIVVIKFIQYADVKNLSLLLVIAAGIPWYLMSLSKRMCLSFIAVNVSLVSIISVYFVNLSIMTSITLYFVPITTLLNIGSFVIMSMVISC